MVLGGAVFWAAWAGAFGAAPASAQPAAGAAAGSHEFVLSQRAADGSMTNETHALAAGEALVVSRLNGKIVAEQSVNAPGGQRVIIKFKDGSLVQQLGQGVQSSAAQAARQQILQNRQGFRDRLLALENQHRSSRGLAWLNQAQLISHEFSTCFSGLAANVHPEILAAIRQMPEVDRVYPDRPRQKLDGYGIAQIGAPLVWQNLGVTGTGIKIAILDTGVDYLHPDLGGGIGSGFKVLGGYDFVNSKTDPMDDNGHGTHVAGIAAANGVIHGVAPGASLYAVKVLDAFGNGFDSTIIAGIEWAVTNGANIINMSLGGPGDPNDPLCQAVDQATAAGVLVVAAAGNSGIYDSVGSPADARTAVAVGADDQNAQIAFFSSRGPAPLTYQIKPEVIAPGVNILSTVPYSGGEFSDPSGYLMLSGTSMASPHMAGAAALLLQEHPQWTPQQVELALMEQAVDIQQDVMTEGSGQINVYASATAAIESTGGQLSLGWDDLRQSAFDSSQTLTVTNSTNIPTQVAFSTAGTVPAGMSVAVTPRSVSLQPGQSQNVTFDLNVNNAVTPNLPAQPFAYAGNVVATDSNGASLHRPFAFCKAPRLTVTSTDPVNVGYILEGTNPPIVEFPFSQGEIETLLPAGNYDLVFDLTALGPPTVIQNVMRDNVAIDTFTDLAIAAADAKNLLTIQGIDQTGQALAPDFVQFNSILTHRVSQFAIQQAIVGYQLPIAQADSCKQSDTGTTFLWDGDLGGFFDDPNTPTYIFHAARHSGIDQSATFAFKPADFAKTILHHASRPDSPQVMFRNWIWELGDGGNLQTGGGYESGVPATTPLDQVVYSIPESDSSKVGGFWSVDGAGLFPSGNLPFWLPDALYKTPPFRATSTGVLVGFNKSGGAIFQSGAQRILLASGPAYWAGAMFNQPGMISIRTTDDDQLDQKLFNGQIQDEQVHGLLAYTLYQNGQVVSSGNLEQAMQYIPGLIQTDLAGLSVAPGAYELVIPFTGFYMNGQPGQVVVSSKFDTTKADPNPPYLTEYQLIDPLNLLQQNPFLDAIPITGAELRFGAADDVKVQGAKLSFQQGGQWLALPLVQTDATHYSAFIPWLGFASASINLRIIVTDTSGNALTLTETIPFRKL